MDRPLLQDRETKPKPRTESIFQLKALRELGEPKVIKDTDIFERPGAKPPKKKPAPKPMKKDRYSSPKSKEQPVRMRRQQGRTYRKG
ncbi:hypothetical protein K0U83_09815 [bacterium]|nr:hypothetical protein [bacterium]